MVARAEREKKGPEEIRQGILRMEDELNALFFERAEVVRGLLSRS